MRDAHTTNERRAIARVGRLGRRLGAGAATGLLVAGAWTALAAAPAGAAEVDPDAFDCSELVQWAASPIGAAVGSAGRPSQAHVAISLGDGRTIR